ncbi:hypothetical protein [Lysobacter capsici]|uniref:hypothetical protein n=1 Tax=Lysobacter capsici TaxID=435897 RepID=UPI00128BAA38|nr:hypothetical protein [Lysobacter capsici]
MSTVWLLYALNLNTSVQLPYGAGWPSRVHNLGLIENRRIHLMLSGAALIVGVVLLGFGRVSDDSDLDDDAAYQACPFCAEPIRIEAVICRHCRNEMPAVVAEETGQNAVVPGVIEEESDETQRPHSYRELREAVEAAERKQ